MISKSYLKNKRQKINPSDIRTIEEFISLFEEYYEVNYEIGEGYQFTDKPQDNKNPKKINPLIQVPRLSDAKVIASIFKEAYMDTYPYKEYENIDYIQKTIKDPNYHWLVFKTDKDEIAGCFMAIIDRKNKRGNIGRFAFFPKYQGVIDVAKASLGTMYLLYKLYEGSISTWYGEARTAHPKSQFVASSCGIKPIAFLPLKDIFLNNRESEILQIGYYKDVLTSLKSKKIPRVIPKILNSCLFSSIKGYLGPMEINSFTLKINSRRVKKLKNDLVVIKKYENFNYIKYILKFNNSDSFFEFLYIPQVKAIEKIKYLTNSNEELICFINKLKEIIEKFAIRYCEIFISAYNPSQQQVLSVAGFKPSGYIPCWEFDENNEVYEDSIIFIYNTDVIQNNIQLIPESLRLLETLNYIKI